MAALPAPSAVAPSPTPPASSPGRGATASHRRLAIAGTQQAWIVFGGQADLPWQRLLRPGFRHCFAALGESRGGAAGWLVLDPLCGRLVATPLDLPAGFDLPGFYRRAGLAVLGPFRPAAPAPRRLPGWQPLSCVGLCRAVLGPGAPAALTPYGLYRALLRRQKKMEETRNLFLTVP